MFQVESNVQIPEIGPAYPFDAMNHGDSFFVPFGEEDQGRVIGRVRQAANYYQNLNRDSGVRLITRKTKDGIRVWMHKG